MKKNIKFLGIPFISFQQSNNKEKIKFLGLSVYKRVYLPKSVKTYYLGIKICKKKINFIDETARFIEQRAYFSRLEQQKEILIVNTDSIGDYIIFRNFLRQVKESVKYKDYKLVLLGCEKYKAFATYLDSDIVDKFLWVPARPQHLSNQKLDEVTADLFNRQNMKHYYDTIVFCSYNSVPKRAAHNYILRDVFSQHKILHSDGPKPSINCEEMLCYTHIFMNYEGKYNFDFQINKDFFEDLLDKKIDLKYPFIEDDKVIFDYPPLFEIKNEYVAINPCAYDNFRMWHRDNWREVIRYLREIKKLEVVIVCSASEKAYCEQLIDGLDLEGIYVLAGLKVQDLLAVLKVAKMYIGQDSGIFHVAAALNMRALCLSAGNAYFRFMNYPKERRNIRVLFPLGTEEWILENKKEFPALVNSVNSFYINCLRVDKVEEEIDRLLKINSQHITLKASPLLTKE